MTSIIQCSLLIILDNLFGGVLAELKPIMEQLMESIFNKNMVQYKYVTVKLRNYSFGRTNI